MNQIIKVVAVNYLNTQPFLRGLEKSELSKIIDLSAETPAVCAEKLMSGQADIGLIPVASIPAIPNAQIISDFCIGCDNEVGTVALFSNSPIQEIEEIILDYQSRTSVELLKLLVKDFWKKQVRYIKGKPGYEKTAKQGQGVLVIGDRAMDLEEKYSYKYDLGAAWKQHTGLPFVFATWVSTTKLSERFIDQFNHSLAQGLTMIPEIIKTMDSRPHFGLEKYYRENISFDLTPSKRQALQLFMKSLGYNLDEKLFRPMALGNQS